MSVADEPVSCAGDQQMFESVFGSVDGAGGDDPDAMPIPPAMEVAPEIAMEGLFCGGCSAPLAQTPSNGAEPSYGEFDKPLCLACWVVGNVMVDEEIEGQPAIGSSEWQLLSQAALELQSESVAKITYSCMMAKARMSLHKSKASSRAGPPSVCGSACSSSASVVTPATKEPLAAMSSGFPRTSPLKRLVNKIGAESSPATSKFGPRPSKIPRRPDSASLPSDADAGLDSDEGDIADDDDDDADLQDEENWAERLELVRESLDAPLPAGKLFGSVARMRFTINQHSSAPAVAYWCTSFRRPTTQALYRRFKKLQKSVAIAGPSVNVEIGYQQCLRRVGACLALHRALRQWIDHQRDLMVVEALAPLRTLDEFLQAVGLKLAPDLMIVRMYALFYEQFKERGSVFAAVSVLNISELQDVCAKCSAIPTPSAPAEETPKEPVVKMEICADEPARLGKGAAKAAPRKPKSYSVTDRIDLKASPADHVMTLMSVAVKTVIKHAASNEEELQDSLPTLAKDFDDANDFVRSMKLQGNDVAEFIEVLEAIPPIYKCGFPDEKDRPPPSNVRVARRVIFATAGRRGPSSDIARALLSYRSGKIVMEKSKHHSAAGLQDEAADSLFESSVSCFEAEYDTAFDNIGAWLEDADDNQHRPMVCVALKLQPMEGMLASLTSAVSRWSTVALERRLTDIATQLKNMGELIGAGLYAMVKLTAKRSTAISWTMANEVPLVAPLESESVAEAPSADHTDPSCAPRTSSDGAGESTSGAVAQATFPADDALGHGSLRRPSFAKNVSELMGDIEALGSSCQRMLKGVVMNLNTLADKLGSVVGDFVDPHPARYQQEAVDNKASLMMMCEYLCASCELVVAAEPPLSTEGSPPPAPENFARELIAHSRLHHAAQSGVVLSCQSVFFDEAEDPQNFAAEFQAFVQGVGQKLFDKYTQRFLEVVRGGVAPLSSQHVATWGKYVASSRPPNPRHKHNDPPRLPPTS